MPMPIAMHAAAAASPYNLGLHPHHHQLHQLAGANGRHLSPPPPMTTSSPAAAMAGAEDDEDEYSKSRQLQVVSSGSGVGGGGARYRECLKNHAASIGGSATDGCGEFMPAGDEGSMDALLCSACGCHRNFHRKDNTGLLGLTMGAHQYQQYPTGAHQHHRGLLVGQPGPAAPTRMVMPLSAAMAHHHPHHANANAAGETTSDEGGPRRKRFRTKFTAEQKARMLGFAEEAGWRLQKLDDAAVHRFCAEVGVKRRVLKVWMHNNKHTLASRRHQQPPPPPEPDHRYPGLAGAGEDDDRPANAAAGRSCTSSPSATRLRLD